MGLLGQRCQMPGRGWQFIKQTSFVLLLLLYAQEDQSDFPLAHHYRESELSSAKIGLISNQPVIILATRMQKCVYCASHA